MRELDGQAGLVLLAEDLTSRHSRGGRILADATRLVNLPVFAVLGNHDCTEAAATRS